MRSDLLALMIEETRMLSSASLIFTNRLFDLEKDCPLDTDDLVKKWYSI